MLIFMKEVPYRVSFTLTPFNQMQNPQNLFRITLLVYNKATQLTLLNTCVFDLVNVQRQCQNDHLACSVCSKKPQFHSQLKPLETQPLRRFTCIMSDWCKNENSHASSELFCVSKHTQVRRFFASILQYPGGFSASQLIKARKAFGHNVPMLNWEEYQTWDNSLEFVTSMLIEGI